MFTDYLSILESLSRLSSKTKNQLQEYISIKNVPKGDFILRHGQICNHIYFLSKGFARIFYFKNEKEITEYFAGEKQFCFSITSFFQDTPSYLVIEAIEDCEVILLHKKGLEKLQKTNLEVAGLLISFLSRSLILSQKRMESIQFSTAKQRYQQLINEHPEVLNKIPLQHIASFLGITQETLSRIRAQI